MNAFVHPTDIRAHYDRLSPLYRRFWGEHIHHGYWTGDESSRVAQLRLVERLASTARVPRGARVLDVGCGLGGSALWLARGLGCSVRGLTLSPVQAETANRRARQAGLRHRFRAEVFDANRLDELDEPFDVIWTIECSEHLVAKDRFVARCAELLHPGGCLALCAWLSRGASPQARSLVEEVCDGMLCPSLGSLGDYVGWMRAAGFAEIRAEDITANVAPTWDRVDAILRRPAVQLILKVAGPSTREFARACGSIRRAYEQGAMAYGMFTAHKGAAGAGR